MVAIREDEIAANAMGVRTREAKILAFVVSSFFGGVAGALFAHQIQFINPSSFDIIKSTEILVMVYLGGIGSLAGSILGAVIFTFLAQALQPLGTWRMVIMPLILVFLMLFRPRGILGFRELIWFLPERELSRATDMSALLEIQDVTMRFGGLCAIANCSIDVEAGRTHGIIGPNGAGKTTLFNLVTGIYRPSSGDIRFKRESISGLRPNRVAALGIARTFQNIRLFKNLTVLENVRVAFDSQLHYSPFEAFFGLPRQARDERRSIEESFRLLSPFGLAEQADSLAGELSYGSQRRLEIARALALKPGLLLLDEPAAGMNTAETATLTEFLRWVRRGVSTDAGSHRAPHAPGHESL